MCSLGSAPAGTYPVWVTFPSLGYSRYANDDVLYFTYQLIISSFSPLSGSLAGGSSHMYTDFIKHTALYFICIISHFSITGGTTLTLEGFGFGPNTVVMVGSEECIMMYASGTELKCKTPPVSVQTAKHNFILTYCPFEALYTTHC